MEKAITKAALINNAVAGDFAQDVNGFITIKYLPKFNSAWLKLIAPGLTNVYRRDTFPSAEVTKSTIVSLGANVTASTKYKLMETTINSFIESYSRQPNYYGYTSPAILGVQADEKHNMYVSLAYKINSSLGAKANAYPVVVLTHGAQLYQVGEILTGATSGAQGIVLDNISNIDVAVGLIGTTLFVVGENIDDQSSSGASAVTGVTVGVALYIEDKPGYYSNYGARGGANTFTAAAGFVASDVTVQSKLIVLEVAALPTTWTVNTVLTGATSGAKAKVVRSNIGANKLIVAFLGGSSAFTGGENISDGTNISAEVSQAAVAAPTNGISTVTTVYNAPQFCYSQGQGADLLLDVPKLARDSQNLNSGSFTGPQGDSPIVGTEYVSSDWSINWPVSVDNIGESTTAIPAPMRLWTEYSDYANIDIALDSIGITN